MKTPTTLEDLENLIAMEVEESLHLDYKCSDAISKNQKKSMTKDISSFANADGGVVIYGVEEGEAEKKHLPVRIDEGVDHRKYSKEWIEQVLSNISPHITRLLIHPIRLSEARSAYVIEIPKSSRGPHFCRNNSSYYRRRNFQSTLMEHYEIMEFQSRLIEIPSLVRFELYLITGHYVGIRISNPGSYAAKKVKFDLPNLEWMGKENAPGIFQNGINELPPKKELKFWLAQYGSFIDNGINPTQFTVSVSYEHPLSNSRVKEQFSFDLNDYDHAVVEKNDIENLSNKLTKELQAVSKKIENLTGVVEKIASVASPTGLNLSATTLRNLENLQSKHLFEKYKAEELTPKGFVEVLGISSELGSSLWHFFRWGKGQELKDIEGMTDEILVKFKSFIEIDDVCK